MIVSSPALVGTERFRPENCLRSNVVVVRDLTVIETRSSLCYTLAYHLSSLTTESRQRYQYFLVCVSFLRPHSVKLIIFHHVVRSAPFAIRMNAVCTTRLCSLGQPTGGSPPAWVLGRALNSAWLKTSFLRNITDSRGLIEVL